jgi:hypothetical protein
MNFTAERWLRVAMVSVFATHAAITGVALAREGWLAPFPPFRDWTAVQLFSDLLCASSLVLLFVVLELRRQRRALWPAALLGVGIALLGSLAVLLFLLVDRRFLSQLLARPHAGPEPTVSGRPSD